MDISFKEFYDPKKVAIRDTDYPPEMGYYIHDVISDSDEEFHIGEGYVKGNGVMPKVVICNICQGKEFNVATGLHYTAIRCVTCLYELCIQEG